MISSIDAINQGFVVSLYEVDITKFQVRKTLKLKCTRYYVSGTQKNDFNYQNRLLLIDLSF